MKREKKQPIIIGVAGSEGSDTESIVKIVCDELNIFNFVHLSERSYYVDASTLPNGWSDLDTPDAIDFDLLVEHISNLQNWKPVSAPVYNLATLQRSNHFQTVAPEPVIFITGVFIFAETKISELCDYRIFVDTARDIRFMRRLRRDLSNPKYAINNSIEQWLTVVKPNDLAIVEPSKRNANIVVPDTESGDLGISSAILELRKLFI